MVAIALAWVGARPAGGEKQTVVIPKGANRATIAKLLQEKRVIRSSFHFLVVTVLKPGVIQAGAYQLDPSQSVAQVVNTLHRGENRFAVVTFPEGWRREQMAQRLTNEGYDGAGFLAATEGKEGYLFPDTYHFPLNATPAYIASAMEANFWARTDDITPTRDQVILASVVERETKRDDQRAIVAGIFSNRLRIGMKLDADPTVQYGRDTNLLNTGHPPEIYWQAITLADYQNVISPFNTYRRIGLPPTPIASPGRKSLEAAVRPADTNALYFFHTSSGELITSRTLEEHNSNKQKFLK